eukprot:1122935-Rhodomonas_salina.1
MQAFLPLVANSAPSFAEEAAIAAAPAAAEDDGEQVRFHPAPLLFTSLRLSPTCNHLHTSTLNQRLTFRCICCGVGREFGQDQRKEGSRAWRIAGSKAPIALRVRSGAYLGSAAA